ncbi:MFS transporter [Virgibacillus halodenitrificans]|uniref:MFS transporter n=1 Tax=Virgibacillus halodenitrificans TaxID=1482 RepID=A0ABR7VR54_VIRHA|nr:MFS transporter [Virgibacillus halodenitrificans]MBD1223821.1 MFS transporter [Virgibacillus halodenitrificans]
MGKKKSLFHYSWWVLIGLCIVVGLGKGALNGSAGLYLSPVAKDLDIGMGNLTLYLSVAAVITMVFLPIGGKLLAKYDTRTVLVTAILLQAGAFVAFGFMSSIWGWYIFAIPLAVGGVFTTVIVGPVLINQWFKKKNGLALGILGASGGALGALAQPAVGNMIADQGWRFAYIALGGAVIIISIPVIILLFRKSPQAIGISPYGAKEVLANENKEDSPIEELTETGVSMADAKKSSAFYALAFFFFLVTSIASFTVHIPTYIINQGYSVTFAGNVMGGYMLGVLFGALAIGFFVDKIGSKKTAISAMLLGMVAVAILTFITGNAVLVTIAVILFGFVASNAISTMAPALTTSLFGSKNYSEIYSTASLGLAVASIIALPLYGYIFDFLGSYTPVLIGIIAMMGINILLILFAFKGTEKLKKAGLWN